MTSKAARPKKILVPIDLSERSKIAISYARMLADALDAELLVTTCVGPHERHLLEPIATSENVDIGQAAMIALRSAVSTHANGTRTSVQADLEGPAADSILRTADDEHVDMIVLSSHGHAGVRKWLLGGVAEKVVRAAHVPVTVVPVS